MAVELRPVTAILVLVAVLAAGSIGSIVVTEASDTERDAVTNAIPLDDDRELWVYTSRETSFDEPTLAINVIVYGDPADVRDRLLEDGRGDWNATGAEEREVSPTDTERSMNATSIAWEYADGADRYVYLLGLDSQWLSETYQVHDGDYLGSRHHIRAYTPPDGQADWTAMQAHHEHWDWFRARHVVTSVDESQIYLEREFATGTEPSSGEIVRKPLGGTDETGFDRWVTIVDLREQGTASTAALLLVVLGTASARLSRVASTVRERLPRHDVRALLLAAGIVTVFMSVRLSGIQLERTLDVPPKTIAFLLYPVLFIGIPVTAYLLARPLDRNRAFSGASVGFLAAILVDYSYLGVHHVPLDVLVHWGALAVSLGLLATGGSRVERLNPQGVSHVRIGVLLWLVAMLLPLLRHTPLPV